MTDLSEALTALTFKLAEKNKRIAELEGALREIAKDSHDLDSKHNAQDALGGRDD